MLNSIPGFPMPTPGQTTIQAVSKLFYNGSKCVRFQYTYFRTLLHKNTHITDYQLFIKVGTGIDYSIAGQITTTKGQH